MNEQKPSDMDRLHAAIKAGKRVEIRRYIGDTSATASVAQDSARRAADANARGERVARIVDSQGTREFDCGVDETQARALLDAGAVEV